MFLLVPTVVKYNFNYFFNGGRGPQRQKCVEPRNAVMQSCSHMCLGSWRSGLVTGWDPKGALDQFDLYLISLT